MNASETFGVGEPVAVNADGELTESADDPVDADIMGIAMAGPGGVDLNPETGNAYTTGDMIPVAIPDQNTYFICSNFATDGAGTQAAPAVANLGDEAGLTLASGVWSVDVGATNNTCRIYDILDDQKRSIQKSGVTLAATDTFYVVFGILSHQSNLHTAGVDAPAA
jgi:hypothetical protein